MPRYVNSQNIRLVYGIGVMLLMVFMPQGLWGTFSSIVNKIKKRYHWGRRTKVGANAEPSEV